MEKKTPHLKSDLIWRQVDENTVVVTPQSGKMRVLNGVGSLIWQLLSENQSREIILDHIVNRYDIPVEQAGADLDKFLAELEARNLLHWGA